jgi:hypothetical protein
VVNVSKSEADYPETDSISKIHATGNERKLIDAALSGFCYHGSNLSRAPIKTHWKKWRSLTPVRENRWHSRDHDHDFAAVQTIGDANAVSEGVELFQWQFLSLKGGIDESPGFSKSSGRLSASPKSTRCGDGLSSTE